MNKLFKENRLLNFAGDIPPSAASTEKVVAEGEAVKEVDQGQNPKTLDPKASETRFAASLQARDKASISGADAQALHKAVVDKTFPVQPDEQKKAVDGLSAVLDPDKKVEEIVAQPLKLFEDRITFDMIALRGASRLAGTADFGKVKIYTEHTPGTGGNPGAGENYFTLTGTLFEKSVSFGSVGLDANIVADPGTGDLLFNGTIRGMIDKGGVSVAGNFYESLPGKSNRTFEFTVDVHGFSVRGTGDLQTGAISAGIAYVVTF